MSSLRDAHVSIQEKIPFSVWSSGADEPNSSSSSLLNDAPPHGHPSKHLWNQDKLHYFRVCSALMPELVFFFLSGCHSLLALPLTKLWNQNYRFFQPAATTEAVLAFRRCEPTRRCARFIARRRSNAHKRVSMISSWGKTDGALLCSYRGKTQRKLRAQRAVHPTKTDTPGHSLWPNGTISDYWACFSIYIFNSYCKVFAFSYILMLQPTATFTSVNEDFIYI